MSVYVNKPVRIFPCFRLSSSTYLSATVVGSHGAAWDTAWVPENLYSLVAPAIIQGNEYYSLLTYLVSEMQGVGADPGTTLKYSNATNRIVLADYGAEITASFSPALAPILGFRANIQYSGSGAAITAPFPPSYLWSSTENGFAERSGEYQDREIMEQRFSDDGTPFSLRRAGVWNSEEVAFTYEVRENVYLRFSTSGSNPYPFESFMAEAQRGRPFLVFHTGSTYIDSVVGLDRAYLLSKDGSRFEPKKEDPYLEDYYKVSLIGLVPPNVSEP